MDEAHLNMIIRQIAAKNCIDKAIETGCEGRVKVKGDSTFFGLSNWKVKVAIN